MAAKKKNEMVNEKKKKKRKAKREKHQRSGIAPMAKNVKQKKKEVSQK